MIRLLLILGLLCSCGTKTPEEHCAESCSFYSECDPSVRPLEETCRTACLERFADPMQIVATCEEAEPRHPIADRYRNAPSLQSSAIEAGECALDQGCPPDEPPDEDPCADIEMICLDTLTPQERCWRTVQIDQQRCESGYQDCIERGEPQNACSTTLQSCYQQANANGQRCS